MDGDNMKLAAPLINFFGLIFLIIFLCISDDRKEVKKVENKVDTLIVHDTIRDTIVLKNKPIRFIDTKITQGEIDRFE